MAPPRENASEDVAVATWRDVGDTRCMVERARRKRSRKRDPNHQRRWLWGRHVVVETLRAARWPIEELYLADSLSEVDRESARVAATIVGAEVFVEPADRLRELGKTSEHQGYLARMGPFPHADLADLIDLPTGDPRPIVLLDGIQDPHNLGAILRSADALGVAGIVIGEAGQVGVTTHVARASAGAVNHVPIARVPDLAAAMRAVRDSGRRLVGTDSSAGTDLDGCDLARPVLLAIGNEGRGLSDDVRETCDELVRIPQSGRVGSLNAGVAAGILFYEAARQRR